MKLKTLKTEAELPVMMHLHNRLGKRVTTLRIHRLPTGKPRLEIRHRGTIELVTLTRSEERS